MRLCSFVLMIHLLNAQSTNPPTSVPTSQTTTLSVWEQAYKEIYGFLPSKPSQIETTTVHIEVNNLTPEIEYQHRNGTVEVIGSKSSTRRPTFVASGQKICRDYATNCNALKPKCNDPIYGPSLVLNCPFTCNRCGECVDQSDKCQFWAARRFCDVQFFMARSRAEKCQKTCNLCST
ncbi:hypothetical protein M3Y95_01022200 [Aphelenchoides besseyi]|nr:hypothetical protein M3Y95_01022200 [Aphelenchoides besseyi]